MSLVSSFFLEHGVVPLGQVLGVNPIGLLQDLTSTTMNHPNGHNLLIWLRKDFKGQFSTTN